MKESTMDKNDEKTINLSPKELTYLFYALIGARDHDWQSGHNKCRRPWDLAKDFCAIAIEGLIPRLQEKESYCSLKANGRSFD